MTGDLLERWRAAQAPPPLGWSLAHLAGRLEEPRVPWDLDATCRRLLARSGGVPDMRAGGGDALRGRALRPRARPA